MTENTLWMLQWTETNESLSPIARDGSGLLVALYGFFYLAILTIHCILRPGSVDSACDDHCVACMREFVVCV